MTDSDHEPGLLITADEKQYGPPFIQPLIVIDGADLNNVRFKMGARITFLDVGGFRSMSSLASKMGIGSQYYHPLTATSRWFVAPLGFAGSLQFDIYAKDALLAEYRHRQAGGALDVGYEINRSSEVRLGYEGSTQRFSPQVGNPNLLPTVSGRQGISSIRYSLIGVNSPTVRRSGIEANFRTAWNHANPAATSGFPLSELQIAGFKRLSTSSSIFLSAAAGTTFDSKQTGGPPFALGGVRALAAYGTNELLTNQYFLSFLAAAALRREPSIFLNCRGHRKRDQETEKCLCSAVSFCC